MPKQPPLSSALLADTAGLIAAGVDGLHRDLALNVVMQAAQANSSLRQLRDYLEEHPGVFRDPRSDAPLALGRVARILAEAGYDIGQPGCQSADAPSPCLIRCLAGACAVAATNAA